MARRRSRTLRLWLGTPATLALALAGACSSPAAPASPQPGSSEVPPASASERFSGLWAGSAQTMTCTGRACSPWVTYPDSPRPFSISVVESAGVYTALLDIDVLVNLTGELRGIPQADGALKFSGSFRPPEASSTGTADIHDFTIRLDPATGMTGAFTYTVHWQTGDTFVTGRVLSAERTLPSPTANCDGWSLGGRRCFDGNWEGDFIVRSVEHCQGMGCNNLGPGDPMTVRLTLSEGTDGLRGSVQMGTSVPVAGAAHSRTARLSGARPTVPCGYPGFDVSLDCGAAIDAMEVSLDQLGRLQGTARFSREYWSGSSGGSQYRSMIVTGDFRNVIRPR